MAEAGMDIDAKVDDAATFRVCLNPQVISNVQPHAIEAFQRHFADWFPGPVLYEQGTEVNFIPRNRELHSSIAFHR